MGQNCRTNSDSSLIHQPWIKLTWFYKSRATENKRSSIWQLCHHWWHRKLSEWHGATDPQVWYQSIFHTITEMTILSCWWNFRHWLQPKLSKWQLWTQPIMKIWWKGQHLSFNDMSCFTREGLLMTKGFWWDENTWSVTLVTVGGVTFLCQFQCRFHPAHLTDLKDPIRQRRLGISFFSSWYIRLEILISTYFL